MIEIKKVGVVVEKEEDSGRLFFNVTTSYKLNGDSCLTKPSVLPYLSQTQRQ